MSDGEGPGAEEEEDFLVGPPPPEVAEELDAGRGKCSVAQLSILHQTRTWPALAWQFAAHGLCLRTCAPCFGC